MKELSQISLNENMSQEILVPHEEHLACVLLLDTSSSMVGSPIESLNKGVKDFIKSTSMDELARKRIDLAIVEFNTHVRVVREFTPISMIDSEEFEELIAEGTTAMGEGINKAIDLVKERNLLYQKLGSPCYRPWIFMITDGLPMDDIDSARLRIEKEEQKGTHGKLKFFAVGVPGYDRNTLTSLTKRVIELSDTNFEGIFNWLAESMVLISVSRVDENPKLPDLPSNAIPIWW